MLADFLLNHLPETDSVIPLVHFCGCNPGCAMLPDMLERLLRVGVNKLNETGASIEGLEAALASPIDERLSWLCEQARVHGCTLLLIIDGVNDLFRRKRWN